MRGYVAYQLVGCGQGHSLVGALAGVQVIATVEAIGKGLGIGGAAHGSIKIDTAIKNGRGAQPLVKLLILINPYQSFFLKNCNLRCKSTKKYGEINLFS